MPTIHDYLLHHYGNRDQPKNKFHKVESVVRKSYARKINEEDPTSPYADFLRNESKIACESAPLDFRELPRSLKVYFPKPTTPPPQLPYIPYTYEQVPNRPYRMPKQRKGTVGDWVLAYSYFIERDHQSMIEQSHDERVYQQHRDMTQKKKIFRKAIKSLAIRMTDHNLSLYYIRKNKGFVKKSYNFYNSKYFFTFIKAGDYYAETLLQANPELAFDVDEFKMTALHWTAREDHPYLTKMLLQKYRANVQAKDIYGRTALHLAVARKSIPCIIRIFIYGGKLESLNHGGKSVRAIAPDSYVKYLLDKLEYVRFLVRSKGVQNIVEYREELERNIKFVLDYASLYF